MYSFSTASHPGELSMEYMRHETTRSGLIVVHHLGRTMLEVESPTAAQVPELAPAIDRWLARPFPNQKRVAGSDAYNGETVHTKLPEMFSASGHAWQDIQRHVKATQVHTELAEDRDEGYPVRASGLIVVEDEHTSRFLDYVATPAEIDVIDSITRIVHASIEPDYIPGGYV